MAYGVDIRFQQYSPLLVASLCPRCLSFGLSLRAVRGGPRRTSAVRACSIPAWSSFVRASFLSPPCIAFFLSERWSYSSVATQLSIPNGPLPGPPGSGIHFHLNKSQLHSRVKCQEDDSKARVTPRSSLTSNSLWKERIYSHLL